MLAQQSALAGAPARNMGSMNLAAGDSLGKYMIAGTLGRGAMGTVYDARDPVIDRRVAIKTIPLVPADDDQDEALARFKREAQAAGRLHHPNIVGVYDYGETESVAYIIMEFVEGRSLKAPLDAHERFAPAETVRIMDSILAGLHYSHGRGVVHRDIKPANIMLTQEGAVKIADFGIARIESSQMTQAGTIMGTPAYMSPEQFMGQTVDLRTDIYSAGVLLYQLLTGERPFDGGMSAIMHKALHTEPPAPSAISVVSPTGFDAVVARAMAKRPERRYQSADEFAVAMRAALATPGPAHAQTALAEAEATIVYALRGPAPATISISAVPATRNGSRAPLLISAAAATVAVIGIGAFFALGTGNPPSMRAALVQPPPPVPPANIATTVHPSPVATMATREVRKPADPALLPIIGAALTGAACSLATVGVVDDNYAAEGVVAGALQAQAQARVTASVAGPPPAWHVATFDGPYCGILDTVRPHVPATFGPGDLTLALKGAPKYLVAGRNIVPQVGLPAFPAFLTVDYVSNDGMLTHIAPITRFQPGAYPAGASETLGTNRLVMLYPASPPFGTDLLLAIASSRPLFRTPRPANDTVRAYLPALQRALVEATQSGEKIQARAVLVETRAH